MNHILFANCRKLYMGLNRLLRFDPSLFSRFSPSTIYILVHVNDILITGSNPHEISALIKQLNGVFRLIDLGEMHYFLGIEATQTSAGAFIFPKPNILKTSLRMLACPLLSLCLPKCSLIRN